nr:hypothetical protein GCM10025699_55220 [Microbacterium flavescens]
MKKVLIAERGEIAVRIAGACAELELGSVSVYADDDADALHVTSADEAWALPTGGAVDPYLDMDALVDVAQRSGADTVHPGCGPLSENAEFARRVVAAGLTWVGPDPETMEVLGDKIAARALADSVGAALVVGTAGPIDTADEAVAFAQKHGLPIALKAAHGGEGSACGSPDASTRCPTCSTRPSARPSPSSVAASASSSSTSIVPGTSRRSCSATGGAGSS